MSQPDKLTSLRAYQPYSASKFCFSPRCSPPLQINHQESPKKLNQTSFSLTLWVVFLQICFKLLALLPLHESLRVCHKLQGPSINLTLWIGVCDTHHVSISAERPYPYPVASATTATAPTTLCMRNPPPCSIYNIPRLCDIKIDKGSSLWSDKFELRVSATSCLANYNGM